jgi:DNA polymerase-3 subunit gamma/tau
MVTTQGFNALLKLVEEPPEHLKFIFATTEPDKVIGTIRSRTHHYPFRLVPPKLLQDYLAQLCEQEGVRVDPAVLPLVVRAGGGSVRDTLSVLDQLIGGAGEDGVTYSRAVALLGYTHDSLLDEVVDALAAHDAAGVFAVVEKVIDSGQDPRRFAEDLLRRLRDLLIISAVPDAVSRGLLDVPADQGERLAAQAARLGTAELTRAADVVNAGLTEMRGATAPRLHLELICARVLLPASDDSTLGLYARLDRIERRLGVVGAGGEVTSGPSPTPAGTPAGSTVEPSGRRPNPAAESTSMAAPASTAAPSSRAAPGSAGSAEAAGAPASGPAPRAEGRGGHQDAGWPDARVSPPPARRESPATTSAPAPATTPAAAGSAGSPASDEPASAASRYSLADVRRMWPDVLEAVKHLRRFTWVMLSQNAQVTALHGDTLTIGLVNAGARDSFVRSGSDEVLRKALQQVLGVDWRIEAVIDPSTGGGGGGPGGAGPGGPGRPDGMGGPTGRRSGMGSGGDHPDVSSGHQGVPPVADRLEGGPGGSPSTDASKEPRGDAWNGSGATGPRRATPTGATSPSTLAEGAGGSVEWPTVEPPGGKSAGAGTGEDTDADVRPTMSADGGQGRPRGRAVSASPGASGSLGAASSPAASASSAVSGSPAASASSAAFQHDPDSEVDPETDAALTDSPLSYEELLRREFGAELIEERVGE